MIALVTFAFLAPALALPGLVALVMNGATETSASDAWGTRRG